MSAGLRASTGRCLDGAIPALVVLGLCASCLACRTTAVYHGEVHPDRRDYAAFRAGHPELIDPNYLPFMVHRIPGDDVRGDDLVFCRWPTSAMPLRVAIAPPTSLDALQHEFNPVPPERFLEAVERALAEWEEAMEGWVRFQLTSDLKRADLRLHLRAERAPSPEADVRVLGMTEGVRGACEASGWDPDADRMRVSYEIHDVVLYLADEYGLLTPEQVRRAAMHELGHALGMRGHSPLSTDLMFSTLGEDRRVAALSDTDVNSFLSLYRLPNGTHYGRSVVGDPPPPPAPGPPSGAPFLSMAPHVDPRLGFDLHTPSGWLRVETPHGVFAANGPFWDYDASIEVFVWPYETIEEFVERFGEIFQVEGVIRNGARMLLHGRRTLRVWLDEPDGRSAEFVIIELGSGRVMLLLNHCPGDLRRSWQPWFDAVLATLELRD